MPPRRSSSTAGRSPGRSPTASTTTTRSSSSSMPGSRAARRAPAEPGGRESMELSEDLKYRLAYLMLRLALDQKLSRAHAGAHRGVLARGFRQLCALAEYRILGVLLYPARGVEPAGSPRAAVLALVLSGLYAGSDELHQWFVPGRGARVSDCLIDVSGAAAGQGLLAARAQRLRPRPA